MSETLPSTCPSTYRPSRDPSLVYRCFLVPGHSGKHCSKNPDSSVIYSWPNSADLGSDFHRDRIQNYEGTNPNRPLNPAAVRATIDLIHTGFAAIGFLLLLAGLVLAFLDRPDVHIQLIGLLASGIGLVLIAAGYRIWRRSLGI